VKPIVLAGLLFSCALAFAQTPAGQPTPAAQQAPTQASKDLDPYQVNDSMSVGVFYWMTKGTPELLGGKKSTDPKAASLGLPQADKKGEGVIFTVPAGRFNNLTVEAFQVKGSGTSTATTDLSLFGNNIPTGDFLSKSFRLRSGKVSWNYLTYPAPPGTAKFRLKTLLEVQYVNVQTVVDPIYDLGTSVSIGTKSIILPTLGMGVELAPSKHFHFEVKASGFTLPHKSAIGDGEGAAVIRVWHLELRAGGKYYYFKTSPQSDVYIKGSVLGPFGGLSWVF